MKKRIIISFLVIISVILGLGGIAIAASPPNDTPKNVWDMILGGIDVLLGRIGEFPTASYATVAEGLEDINSDVDSVQTSVDGVQTSVDLIQTSIDNMSTATICMESDKGYFHMQGGNPDIILDEEYDRVAHVSLTVYGLYIDSGDSVWAVVDLGTYSPAVHLIDNGVVERHTVEFDTDHFQLNCHGDDLTENVYWAYTVTYPAQ